MSPALKIPPPRENARFGPLRAELETNWEENSPKLYRAPKKTCGREQEPFLFRQP